MSDYISRDELLELYPFDPDCEGCSVPYPIVRQNILDIPAADVIERTAAVNSVLGLTITDERVAPYMVISREQIEKVWNGCDRCQPPCISCDNIYAWDRYGKPNECTSCPENGYKNYIPESPFCEYCGKPLTDEAVQMVMERLEALRGDR